ncbi:hypothetical protein [Clostridium estertheticum]|uniref:hypothetical protein n=1 Tax=Clostridium estertheticum TaxID=238834 RepID=UPI001CF19A21|nr:hypothetical protein [Clostridium estertheticum]MCB2343298.1 hypothetical protein [Clostridium estertheticum]
MMNGMVMTQLSEIIHDKWHQIDSKQSTNLRIKHILGRKKISTIIKELLEFKKTMSDIEKKKFQYFTLIVVLIIIIRNLDCIDELQNELEISNLIGPLYGGMYKFMCGNSQSINIKVKWNDSMFENKYEFITRFHDYKYWEYIEIFKAGTILYKIDKMKFERLVMDDKSKLFLLNMVSEHIHVEPSEQFIQDLLMDKDELKQNIGFIFLSRPIDYCISKIQSFNREKEMGIKSPRQGIREIQKSMRLNLQHLESNLFKCDKGSIVSLIVNYILVNNKYPKIFSLWLMDVNLQDKLIIEIRNSKKIRRLTEVYLLLSIISKKRIQSSGVKIMSKSHLYDGIVDIIIKFISEGKGVYVWDNKEHKIFSDICKILPSSQKNKLRKFLVNEEKGLMVSKLDQLIRFKIFLKDQDRKNIIDGMLSEI